jgi:hypothetical protein
MTSKLVWNEQLQLLETLCMAWLLHKWTQFSVLSYDFFPLIKSYILDLKQPIVVVQICEHIVANESSFVQFIETIINNMNILTISAIQIKIGQKNWSIG